MVVDVGVGGCDFKRRENTRLVRMRNNCRTRIACVDRIVCDLVIESEKAKLADVGVSRAYRNVAYDRVLGFTLYLHRTHNINDRMSLLLAWRLRIGTAAVWIVYYITFLNNNRWVELFCFHLVC
ncbi:unnamed protein product [Macrosiphum euphorbiae]|uniref:Uncharacterized protein n=1 Tax=Macrosiphum euphorbiae TaxID=13131 RepID=A0AAV0X1A1_9HEMI|nr:unnamed protein product [Macrosiphum euphorbiae]